MVAFTWTTSGGGDWSAASDWSPLSGPPGAGDVAIFENQTVLYTVTVTSSDAAGLIEFNATPGLGVPTLSINGGGVLTTSIIAYVSAGPPPVVTVNPGGLLNVTTAFLEIGRAETITIDGGTLELGNLSVGTFGGMTFDFNDTGAGILQFTTTLNENITTASQHITNVAATDEFVITDQNFIGDTVNYSGTTLTVHSGGIGGPIVFTMDDVHVAPGTTGFVITGAVNNIIEAVCYARGTMIRTPGGELQVEKLRPGKRVITLVDGQEIPQTVTWLGHRRIGLAGHPRPETVAPIRIQRDAFADGIPHRDLVVSPDHAIFVDGKLICARQLVNGTTILQERDWTAVDYYHIELDQHAILLAEGLPAESYIDTGNSGFFANSGAPLALHPDLTDESGYPTREAGSCVPFVWDEASVQPVWQRLADRAATPPRVTTTDADLRLFADRRPVKAVYSDSDRVIFVLPRGAREVQLVSRAQSPTEARPWLEDRRRLGVRMKRIVLRSADETREVPVDHPDLTRGWWAVERDGQVMSRWTDGEAVLPLPAMSGNVMLEIHLAGSMIYAVDDVVREGETDGSRLAEVA